MANRGLYGCAEGNEVRGKGEKWDDHLNENRIAEGEWLNSMIRAAKEGDLKELTRLRNAMRTRYIQGKVNPTLAQERADSNLRQAMNHFKF